MATNCILIADDDEICVYTLQNMLEDRYHTEVAFNGKSVLDMVPKVKPDLLLLDLNMPDMDGFQVLEELRRRGEGVPVIFVTGEEDEAIQMRGLELGAADYVSKNTNHTILNARVHNQLEMSLYRSNLEKMVDQRTTAVSETLNAVVIGMALLAEVNDPHTGAHIQRVRSYCEVICNQMLAMNFYDVTPAEYKLISALSPVHDIGKVGIPDAVLLKPGRLTPEEFAVMEKHTVYGGETLLKTEAFLKSDEETLKNELHSLEQEDNANTRVMARKSRDWLDYRSNFLRVAREIAVGHHERWDGTGYPYKLKGSEVPLSARIVSLADIYDALTSVRPYKKAFSHADTMDILLKGDGRTKPEHFDPNVLAAFSASAKKLEQIAEVLKEKQ